MLGAPGLDLVIQVEFHKSRIKGENHLSQLVGHSAFDAVQTVVGFLGCECMLLGHVEALSN